MRKSLQEQEKSGKPFENSHDLDFEIQNKAFKKIISDNFKWKEESLNFVFKMLKLN